MEQILEFPPTVNSLVTRYERELNEVLTTPIGKPAKYYRAYKTYTLDYNMTQLRILRSKTPSSQQHCINELLKKYEDAVLTLKRINQLI